MSRFLLSDTSVAWLCSTLYFISSSNCSSNLRTLFFRLWMCLVRNETEEPLQSSEAACRSRPRHLDRCTRSLASTPQQQGLEERRVVLTACTAGCRGARGRSQGPSWTSGSGWSSGGRAGGCSPLPAAGRELRLLPLLPPQWGCWLAAEDWRTAPRLWAGPGPEVGVCSEPSAALPIQQEGT